MSIWGITQGEYKFPFWLLPTVFWVDVRPLSLSFLFWEEKKVYFLHVLLWTSTFIVLQSHRPRHTWSLWIFIHTSRKCRQIFLTNTKAIFIENENRWKIFNDKIEPCNVIMVINNNNELFNKPRTKNLKIVKVWLFIWSI